MVPGADPLKELFQDKIASRSLHEKSKGTRNENESKDPIFKNSVECAAHVTKMISDNYGSQ